MAIFLGTSFLLKAIYENLGRVSVADLAYSAHVYMAKGLAALAIEQAQMQGTKNVGFTGGAACNQLLAQTIREAVESAGLKFYVHERFRQATAESHLDRQLSHQIQLFRPNCFYRPKTQFYVI
jgi:hydrogenase maturation factor HypF (carbamoyltransferase family)